MVDTSLNWEDIKWLRSITKMQIWLKGGTFMLFISAIPYRN